MVNGVSNVSAQTPVPTSCQSSRMLLALQIALNWAWSKMVKASTTGCLTPEFWKVCRLQDPCKRFSDFCQSDALGSLSAEASDSDGIMGCSAWQFRSTLFPNLERTQVESPAYILLTNTHDSERLGVSQNDGPTKLPWNQQGILEPLLWIDAILQGTCGSSWLWAGHCSATFSHACRAASSASKI